MREYAYNHILVSAYLTAENTAVLGFSWEILVTNDNINTGYDPYISQKPE